MSESNIQYRLSRVHGGWVRPFVKNFIKHVAASSVLSVLAALTLESARAVAQEQARAQSVEIFGGEQFGDSNQHLNTSETTLGSGWRF
jgi:hypothetical protein